MTQQGLRPLLLSVVIPTCNRWDHLATCLELLAPGRQSQMEILACGQEAGGAEAAYEVIVTDDGGENPAEELVRSKFPWARWLPGPRRGPAANRNNGASQARGDWLVFCDDDCRPDRFFLVSYARAISSHDDTIVLDGRTLPDRPKQRMGENCPGNPTGGFLWSCNFAIRASAFAEVGGFNQQFPYAAMEDVDLRARLEQRGWRPQFVADALVMHPWRPHGGWQSVRRSLVSHRVYWALHPEALAGWNCLYFLRVFGRRLFRILSIELIRYRGRGWRDALAELASPLVHFAAAIIWRGKAFCFSSQSTSSKQASSHGGERL